MSAPGEAVMRRVVVIGGGPAGLLAAETARDAGADVAVFEQMASPARKFLIAGKGGLNLTHSEGFDAFVQRYRERAPEVGAWLADFGPQQVRAWAASLGYDTVIGSSGRVFPADFKAGPLLRAWIRRIRAKGVALHLGHRWTGWTEGGALRFEHAGESVEVATDAVILALGGASWPELGSDGAWTATLQGQHIGVRPLAPANCGFECDWSAHVRERFAGAPVKSVALRLPGTLVDTALAGEFMLTEHGVEGSAIYALSAELREAIARDGHADLLVDLLPTRNEVDLAAALAKPRGKRTLSEHLRRCASIDGARAALLFEGVDRASLNDPATLAARIKALPLRLLRTRPIAEAISSAGGVRFEELTADLQLRRRPGTWCAGEMIDWEAPTGGYLLTACFASGYVAGKAAAGVAQ
ncbi:MAG: TIGR03862 family flavoprotein [Rhodanobacteraceae bacterium]|nr:TIGR03862 family flavoprotein [Rhodanobacteraceae bacterium]